MNRSVSDLVDYIKDEQECLWFDFYQAILSAHNDVWSVDCENKLNRICKNIELVGPIAWVRIQKALLDSRIYQRVLAALGWIGPSIPEDLGEFLPFKFPLDSANKAVTHIHKEEWK